MTDIALQEERPLARPLKVLVPLIKDDLRHGDEASAQAGMPFYRAAGAKMLEAKSQMKHGEFRPWIKRHFEITDSAATRYMALVESENVHARTFSSVNEALRASGHSAHRSVTTRKGWHEPVKENIERAKQEAQRLRDETLSRQQEREAERKLALRLIDIGFRVLSKELHPDKGGSRDVMSRLGRVRDRLKASA